MDASSIVNALDVVIEETEPLRVAEVYGVATGLARVHIGPVFLTLSPKLMDHLQRSGARPGVLVHYYDPPAEDGTVGVHVGYDIGEQPVPAVDGVEIVDLPVIPSG
jgi:hypothetical protein